MQSRAMPMVMIFVVAALIQGAVGACTANCLLCFGPAANQCQKCQPPFKMQRFSCISGVCDADYLYDPYDNTCKKSRYKYEYPCEKGYYNSFTQKTSVADCLDCPPGSYCPGLAFVGPIQPCVAGYYCEARAYMGMNDDTVQDRTKICTEGYYCPTSSSTKVECPAGKYCDRTRLTTPTGDCSPGYICTGKSTISRPTDPSMGKICPEGHYCPQGTTETMPCPVGKYLSSKGGWRLEDCVTCPPGKYCGTSGAIEPQGDCDAGFYCPAGSTSSTPPSNYCPTGHCCPTGSAEPIPCNVTDYQSESMKATCNPCPVGYYCEDGKTKKNCPAGNYCPGNNVLKNCPPGTFRSDLGGSALEDCSPCLSGYACDTPGLVSPITTCAEGHYCGGGTPTRFPTDPVAHNGSKCTAGFYCPERSGSKKTCTEGYYCSIDRLASPVEKCQEGYYCPAGSASSREIICPTGKFCPLGTSTPSVCPQGTYGPLQGADKLADCVQCDQGHYCDNPGMSAPHPNPCAAGYYCDQSQYSPSPATSLCPKGHKCPIGSVAPYPCPPGEYQPDTGKDHCEACPAGYYCDGSDPSKSFNCPRGYYCDLGTAVANQLPCPAGKYYDKVGANATSKCISCPKGFYCPTTGMVTYSEICAAGYICELGSPDPNPTSATGYKCPQGYYCPAGNSDKVECTPGTFYDGYMATQQGDCQNLPSGVFCNLGGMSSATLLANWDASKYYNCSAGYLCLAGSYTSAPTSLPMGKQCEKGTYCPAGTKYQIDCPIGKYNGQPGKGTCQDCPAGKYCPNTKTIDTLSCLSRNYCPLGSGLPTPCPPGKFSSQTELTAESECGECPGGSYCEVPATDTSSKKCAAGYVCSSGSADRKPSGGVWDGINIPNGFCPPGSMCPEGSARNTFCSKGYYQDAPGNEFCKKCPNGYGCTKNGIDNLNDDYLCTEGYFCVEASESLTPVDGTTGNVCPIGFFCPKGTPREIRCADGSYQPNKNRGACDPCPAGKSCFFKKGNAEITKIDCPAYYYCPGNNSFVGKLCEPGYASSVGIEGLKKTEECDLCGKGKYCVDAEKDSNAGDKCAAGYYCESNATNPTPASHLCSPGFYCDFGTTEEVVCPAGKFRQEPGAMSSDECSICKPGQYCTRGNPIPDDCPTGSYCPLGASQPINCPIGSYNSLLKAKQRYECTSCPAGFFCQNPGLSTYFLSPCPSSKYCLERATMAINCLAGFYITSSGKSASDCKPCSVGYYCPSGTSSELKCQDGKECDGLAPAESQCEGGYFCMSNGTGATPINKYVCPAGYYCPIGSKDPTVCPADYICPEKSIRPIKCPFGSFLVSNYEPTTVKSVDEACLFCGRGYYAGVLGCEPCPAGYICLGKTYTKYPVNADTDRGYECPAGYFCPEQSLYEQPCPVGSYRNKKKGKSLDDCIECPENTFNDKIGQSACRKCGPNAESAGNHTCRCVGKYREFFKSDSSCRCMSGFYQVKYGIKSEQDDSSVDCEPIVYSDCGSDKIYDFKGDCVEKTDCSAQCRSGSGTYSDGSGICVCDNVTALNDVCDSDCRSKAIKVVLNSSGVIAYDPQDTSKMVYLLFTEDYTIDTGGVNTDDVTSIPMKVINVATKGFEGSYSAPPSILQKYRLKYPSRLLADSSPIESPIVCATVNESVAFGVSREDYPVYLKDSLVNSVKDFDYGPFLMLADKLTKSETNTSVFLYRFSAMGTYLFGSSADNNLQMIVKVMNVCNESYILPITQSSLTEMSVSLRDDVIKGLPLWAFMVTVACFIAVVLIVLLLVRYLWEWLISWLYGVDMVSVIDKKKVGEPEDEEEEMEKLIQKSEEGVDGLFFVYLKQKLSEMDEKMRGLLAKANISSIKKLQKLADKITRLKEIFNEHVGALIMPNGMTIEEFIKANEDKLAQDTSDYSSIIDESEIRSVPETPRDKKPSDMEKPESKRELEELRPAESLKPEAGVEKDIKRDAEKIKEEERETQDNVRNELEKRKKDYMEMVLKHGAGGNMSEVQDYLNEELERIKELRNKLDEELTNQNAGLNDKLMRRQEKKLKALAEVEKLQSDLEDVDSKKRIELEKLHEDRKAELEAVDKESMDEHERGIQIIDKKMSEQLSEQHSNFIQQFAVSEEKDKLLARHEGETQRLKEHLESERRRLQRELENKLDQRGMKKKQEIMNVYKKQEEGLNQKYGKMSDEIEAKKVAIEGDVPANETNLVPYLDELDAERKRVVKQQEKETKGEDMMLDAKKRSEADAIEKEYQLEERKIYTDNRQEVDELLKREIDENNAMKERFLRESKSAPTYNDKKDIIDQYEKAKKDLKGMLEEERRKVEDRTEDRLTERKRLREKKKIQLEGQLEQERREVDKKSQNAVASEVDKHTDEAIEGLIAQAVGRDHLPLIDIPVIFEYLVRGKLNQNLNDLKKVQFADLSQQLSANQTQLMKEKFIEIADIKEKTERKIKDMEKKEMGAEQYQKKLERIQRNEAIKIEGINTSYENKALSHESRIRSSLANQHYDEIAKLVDNEENGRQRLLDKILRKYNTKGDIPMKVVDELNTKKKQDFDEMREEAKREREQKLLDAQKVLGDMNQEELKEMEKKFAQEIESEAKDLERKLMEDKKKAVDIRKKQYEERLAKIPEISIEQRKQLMAEHQRDLERLEKAMAEAREIQLKSMREKLISKRVQQERLRARAEQKAAQKNKEKMNEPVVVIEGVKEAPAPKKLPRNESLKRTFAYKGLLKQWAEKIGERKVEESKTEHQPSLFALEKSSHEEVKEQEPVDETEGAYVNLRELFGTVYNCYDLASGVRTVEFPEISKEIEKLSHFVDALIKGGKRLAEANISRLGGAASHPDS